MKSGMVKKGLLANIGKTKILSVMNLDLLSVLQEQVEMQSSVVAACCGCTRIAVVLIANFAQTLSLGAPGAWTMHS